MRRIYVTDHHIRATVKPDGSFGESREPGLPAIDILGVMMTKTTRRSQLLSKKIE
jgi:hypothetical protein